MDDSTLIRNLKSPVLWFTAVAVAMVTVQSLVELPAWVNVTIAVILAMLGVFGVYGRVTPVNDPRDAEGNALVRR